MARSKVAAVILIAMVIGFAWVDAEDAASEKACYDSCFPTCMKLKHVTAELCNTECNGLCTNQLSSVHKIH